ncbi:MAG: hypothetical protein AAF585_01450 [Verrucomicrobiota bacterium]
MGGAYTGGKYSVYEGGTRTPFITRWKGRIKPGVSDEIVCTIDLPASLTKLAGLQLPDDGCLDSFEISGALLGDEGAKGRDHLVQQNNGNGGIYGLRAGDWKLLRHDNKKARNVLVEAKLANTDVPQFQLFNLADDPAEKTDLMESNKEMGEKLKAQLAKIIEDGRSRP